MVQLQRLTEDNLKFMKNKQIIFYGRRLPPMMLLRIFKQFEINIIAAYAEEKPIIKSATVTLFGVRSVTLEQLPQLIQKHSNVILQSTFFDANEIVEMKNFASEWNVECSALSYAEIINAFGADEFLKVMNNPFVFALKRLKWKFIGTSKNSLQWERFRKNKPKNAIVVCSPTKTGDHTIMCTLKALQEKSKEEGSDYPTVSCFNVWHKPKYINRSVCEKQLGTLKLLVGMREPISQNLSMLYQFFSDGNFDQIIFGDIENNMEKSKQEILAKYAAILKDENNKEQLLWNELLKEYSSARMYFRGRTIRSNLIQFFMQDFQEEVLDITAYAFDTEKGYTIIKEGNTEVFLYQLEKLNSLVPELSNWVGVPFDRLEKGNAAEDKWLAESYKQAQKEIEITQEYFDKCFDEPYVKHCYSEADIEKFKARWRPHIKK